MIRDATALQDGDRLSSEVCIIGAGAAGITVARALAASGRNVIVLEGGGAEFEVDSQKLYEGSLSDIPFNQLDSSEGLTSSRLRFLGGTSNHWGGYCHPLRPQDFERRPWLERSGWPITAEDMDPWYRKAATVLELGPFEWSYDFWKTKGAPGDPLPASKDFDTRLIQRSGVQFGVRYKTELEESTAITLYLHANVVDLELGQDSNAIQTVHAKVVDGASFTVSARAVVVAVGGIETPRLLLACNKQRPAGLGNHNDQVGRHFCEHINTVAGVSLMQRTPAQMSIYASQNVPHPLIADKQLALVGSVGITPAAAKEHSMLDMYVQMVPEPVSDSMFRSPGSIKPADMMELIDSETGSPPPTQVLLNALAEQELNPASRLTLTNERDALGIPKANLNWTLTALDRDSVVRGFRLLANQLGADSIGRVQLAFDAYSLAKSDKPASYAALLANVVIDPSKLDMKGFFPGTGNHHMCTTRMAASPREGVVDAHCKVHDIDNLFIASSAAFGTPGAFPPTMTIAALALRIADHLHAKVLA